MRTLVYVVAAVAMAVFLLSDRYPPLWALSTVAHTTLTKLCEHGLLLASDKRPITCAMKANIAMLAPMRLKFPVGEEVERLRFVCDVVVAKTSRVPPHVGIVANATLGKARGDWVVPPGAPNDNAAPTALWVHGGGFVACSPRSHRPWAANWGEHADMRVFLPDYPLAPAHRVDDQIEFIADAYAGLLQKGVPASKIVFVGDSIGGALVVHSIVRIRARGLPLPGAVVLYSIFVDFSVSSASSVAKNDIDVFLESDTLRRVAQKSTVLQDLPLERLTITNDWPAVYVQVGEDEVLLDDSLFIARKLREAGVANTELRRTAHGYHIMGVTAPQVPEATEENRRGAQWARRMLKL